MERIKIEKLVFGGQAIGKLDGKVVFVWNALPGEEVEIEITKKRKTHLEAIATNIISPSDDRMKPREKHFLSCSPWQIMSIEKEKYWKSEIAKEVYQKIGRLSIGNLPIYSDKTVFGYRNKIEYSFAEKDEKISFAFFERNTKRRYPIDPCELANKRINEIAVNILEWINRHSIPYRSLKALIIRTNTSGEVIAGLFIKDEINFSDYPKIDTALVGFQLFYSTHKSPASVPTKLLYDEGRNYLTEKINSTKLKYGLFSFFQVNIPVFEKALNEIDNNIDESSSLVDMYSGVGSISIPLSKKIKDCTLVEINDEAIAFANENIKINELLNYESIISPAEKSVEYITKEKVVILDPPRAGLHEAVVDRILSEKPKKLIYLSCNPSTHARDICLLSKEYGIKDLRLFNFFPRTPHIESLCILELK